MPIKHPRENHRKGNTHNYLEEQQKSHPKQYGYKKGRSTVDAISHIVNKIKTRKTTYVVELFVDFSGAFDRMSWPRLFSFLRDLQILPDIYNLLRSYFQDREVLIRTPECIARKKMPAKLHTRIHIMEYISRQSVGPSW